MELKEAADIQNIRILWEKNNAAYRYTVEASADGKDWKQVVDQSNNKEIKQITPHKVDAKGAKFFKITFQGSTPQYWGSLWEFEAYTGALPKLPRKVMKAAENGSNNAATGIVGVKAPEGFEVNLFTAPP